MTAQEAIAKIRDEFERRFKETQNREREEAYDEILSFLDTIEEPVCDIDYEQELYNHFGQVKDFTLGMRIAKYFYELGHKEEPVCEELEEAAKKYANDTNPSVNCPCGDCLYDSFIAGAEWQKEKDYANIPASLVDKHILQEYWANGRLHGIQEMKEQMMKEAVEYEVGMHGEPIEITLDKYVQRARGIFPGDKVKIIIIKEGEK